VNLSHYFGEVIDFHALKRYNAITLIAGNISAIMGIWKTWTCLEGWERMKSFSVHQQIVPVLLLQHANLPQQECLLPLRAQPERLANPDQFSMQLCSALRRSNIVVIIGGFFGETMASISAVRGVMAYTAAVTETRVKWRWLHEGETRLGAQVCARKMIVYTVPNEPALALPMLRYIAWAHGTPTITQQPFSDDKAKKAAAETAPPAKVATPKPPREPKPRRKISAMAAMILIVAVLVAIASGGWLLSFASEAARNQNINDNLSSQFHNDREQEQQQPPTPEPQRLSRFASLYEENSDIIGWINIPAADVDLPVLQGDDNEFYLYHDFNGRFTRYGSIFLCAGKDIHPNRMTQNLSVYGHNTRNGSMFGRLSRFRNIDTLRNNPTFTFTTLYEEIEWVIFALFITNADPAQDNGNFFEYRETVTQELLDEIHARSMITTGVAVAPNDQLLSLTTCTYEFNDARLVVFARRVSPGETFNLSGAQHNHGFRRPAAWRR